SAVISDSTGTPVRSINLGALTAGSHPVTWDGLDDQGNAMAAGSYQLKVVAADITGTPINAQAERSGQVTAVRFTASGGSQLVVNGSSVDISKISQITL
ncbi:MAG: FlgD immunoglobulin-like domain containing protein, partial [Mariprofundales bacterium]|nr:FlgD immunoglobulin-like domain containing protein [Mariprofundales bacterium]